jgi:hypothetical protein
MAFAPVHVRKSIAVHGPHGNVVFLHKRRRQAVVVEEKINLLIHWAALKVYRGKITMRLSTISRGNKKKRKSPTARKEGRRKLKRVQLHGLD